MTRTNSGSATSAPLSKKCEALNCACGLPGEVEVCYLIGVYDLDTEPKRRFLSVSRRCAELMFEYEPGRTSVPSLAEYDEAVRDGHL